jgi:hypothetical protein
MSSEKGQYVPCQLKGRRQADVERHCERERIGPALP